MSEIINVVDSENNSITFEISEKLQIDDIRNCNKISTHVSRNICYLSSAYHVLVNTSHFGEILYYQFERKYIRKAPKRYCYTFEKRKLFIMYKMISANIDFYF